MKHLDEFIESAGESTSTHLRRAAAFYEGTCIEAFNSEFIEMIMIQDLRGLSLGTLHMQNPLHHPGLVTMQPLPLISTHARGHA